MQVGVLIYRRVGILPTFFLYEKHVAFLHLLDKICLMCIVRYTCRMLSVWIIKFELQEELGGWSDY